MKQFSRAIASKAKTVSGLLHQPNFLSPRVCDRLIHFFQENIQSLGVADVVPSFSYRVISYRSLREGVPHHLEVKRLFDAVRFLVSQRIAEFFHEITVLPEKTQLVVWPEGTQQALHRDVTRSTTTYASVIYLNDDFIGGETFFAEYGAVKPRRGAMIAFHGVRDEHGVKMVRSGTRYTMPLWFTDAAEAAEDYGSPPIPADFRAPES